jgi:hypothetical protein
MNPQDAIDAFFLQDGNIQTNGSIQRSVFLALEKDFSLCILLPRVWKGRRSPVQLSDEQYTALQTILPTFTVVSLFCTAVDVIARVVNKRAIPPPRQNSTYFINCAETWFGLSNQEARELWQLRNGISHSYRLFRGQAARQFGHGRIILQRPDGVWEFYLHAMYGAIQKAKTDVHVHLSAEQLHAKQLTANYLEQNGFFYTS